MVLKMRRIRWLSGGCELWDDVRIVSGEEFVSDIWLFYGLLVVIMVECNVVGVWSLRKFIKIVGCFGLIFGGDCWWRWRKENGRGEWLLEGMEWWM